MTRWATTPPSTEEWQQLRASDVTSTESAALFDASPYLTEFELYYRKLEKLITSPPSSDRMLWGSRLQDVVARGIAEDQGVKVRKMNQYMRLVEARMGSSFDFEIIGLAEPWDADETQLRQIYREDGVGNFEIKCVDYIVFRDQWTADGGIDPPAHIEIQVQHQLHVANRPWAAVGILVAGHTPKMVIRHRDQEVGEIIESRVTELFERVEMGIPPEPRFPDDADLLCKLHGWANPGSVYDGHDDTELLEYCAEYVEARDRESKAAEDKKVAKAKIFDRIGTAERAFVPGFTISASITSEAVVPTHFRPAFRNVRITAKKPIVSVLKES